MEEKFSAWLVKVEGKIEATGRSYSRAINRLSEHYSSHTGNPTNIYKVDNGHLKRIKGFYDTDGRFSEFGYESHGLYRAAIKALYRYRQSHPISKKFKNTKSSKKPRSTAKNRIKRKTENRGQSIFKKIYEFFINLFQPNQPKELIKGDLVGTRKQIYKHLKPLSNNWEKEVQEKYLTDNPKCQRCGSGEFPSVFEKPVLTSKKVLKNVIKDIPNRGNHSISISNIENDFKGKVIYGNRLMVLCRTCKKKEEKLKLDRYPHEMPEIMRKGPSELKY
ncbi:hypothetical protein C7S20_16730 [Christiangramia fulva]|uniref:Uncharacterized protein n=1 Tax=Christiangramia fulva TaxID=2126553 RepID=A0A2R3Z977_9FLAO|nr:hypothetical protein [Christiangramia fulva]AVR46774.1 hypothetical protein C7S20_16730 [Christiangramia fulva]